MKILLVYLQPKDGLTKVSKHLYDMGVDVLKLKYYPYPLVYQIARKTIESHPEYTHIVWLQNDIVLKKKDFIKLVNRYHSTGEPEILGASMNVDLSKD